MATDRLYSISGVFSNPDGIMRAAEETVREGYTKFDVHSPYPLHGMSGAMRLKPSKLGYITLFFGLSGAAAALFFMYWVNVFEYPLVIGGKPLFQLPAFIPVAFEVTVLLASVCTVLGMLFVFFRFPNNSHPLMDTAYMKQVSLNKYGLTILAADPRFNEHTVRDFMKRLEADTVYQIEWEDSESGLTRNLFDWRFIVFQAIVILGVAGTTYFILNHLPYLPPFDWMANQEKISPQEKSMLFADGFGMRQLVEGTIARGHLPYAFSGQADLAAALLVNPLLPAEDVILAGQDKYGIFCSPCHGNFGKGDSRLRGQFPNPPTLHSDKVRGWSDGMLFHLITEGQNIMPAYAGQLVAKDRWAIVHYLRILQRAVNAKESDLK